LVYFTQKYISARLISVGVFGPDVMPERAVLGVGFLAEVTNKTRTTAVVGSQMLIQIAFVLVGVSALSALKTCKETSLYWHSIKIKSENKKSLLKIYPNLITMSLVEEGVDVRKMFVKCDFLEKRFGAVEAPEMRHPRALVLPVPVQVGLVPVGFPARVALVFP
jgi:hypothetical protein